MAWGSGHKSAENGPKLLLNAGLADRLSAKKVTIIEPIIPFGGEGVAYEQVIMEQAGRVSQTVEGVAKEGFFPVVIGGDHTSAIGFYTGLSRAFGQLGVVWIDTHPDLNTPETSPSGNIHGMVMAGLLGRGSTQMLAATKEVNISDFHVAMVGVRSVDESEKKWLDEGRISCMTMDHVNKVGLEQCLSSAVQIANGTSSGFGITIDLDAIDPNQAPFVATPVEGGIDVDALTKSLGAIPHRECLLGMEVTEFTPRSNEDAEAGVDLVANLVSSAVC